MLRLITIPISHYCEKARWALDRAGIAYREERHVQGIHQLVSRRAGGHGTVPVLVTPDGALGESEEILDWVDQRTPAPQRLFPEGEIERQEVRGLCRRLDSELGPRGRRLMYVHMLAQRDLAVRFNNQGVPGWEDRLIRHAWPLASWFVKHELDIQPGVEVEDERVIWRELDLVAERRGATGGYLCGDRFGAADLTFAALCAALIVPPVYGVPLPQPDLLDPATAALVERMRQHPAGQYALRLFAEHRAVTV